MVYFLLLRRSSRSVMQREFTMPKSLAVLSVFLLAGTQALAQPGNALDGSWQGYYVTQAGTKAKAELSIQGSSGTWRAFIPQAPGRVNPCFERAHPLELTEQASGRFRMVVHSSRTMSGCQDFTASLTLVDPTHIDGQFGDGRELQLERK
ncbi:MAG: hypothetical protein KF683_24230 [Rubrivivax sp.]|nr:hypothetical protein [Rubrivivax sp.]